MNTKKKLSKRGLALIVAAGLAISALAVGIGITLASPTATQVRLTAPNDDLSLELGVVTPVPAPRASFSLASDPSRLQVTGQGSQTQLTGLKTGSSSFIISDSGVSPALVQVNNSTQIAGYDLLQAGEINKKLTDSGFSALDYVTTYVNPQDAPDDSYQEDAAAKDTISWTSSNETVAEITDAGDVTLVAKGAVILTGRFEDKWGLRHDLSLLLGVGVTVGNFEDNDDGSGPLIYPTQPMTTTTSTSTSTTTTTATTTQPTTTTTSTSTSTTTTATTTQPTTTTTSTSTSTSTSTTTTTQPTTQPFDDSEAFMFVMDTSISPDYKNVTLQIGANSGNSYKIDWGDGTVNSNTASHTYAGAQEYTIKIAGTLPGGITFENEKRLKRVLSPLLSQNNTLFERAFYECRNLTTIPANLFHKNPAATYFHATFSSCTSLASIPAGLFDQNTKTGFFDSTFSNCSSLTTIPAGLFDYNTTASVFLNTFKGCTKLTAIPAGLFDKNTLVRQFDSVFQNCTSLTAIPSKLFDYNPNVVYFYNSFSGCTNITGALPELWSGTATKFPVLTGTTGCFAGCTSASNYASVPTAWR